MTEIAPYFSLARAAWVSCVVLWDETTDELRRVEGTTPYGIARRLRVSRAAVDELWWELQDGLDNSVVSVREHDA